MILMITRQREGMGRDALRSRSRGAAKSAAGLVRAAPRAELLRQEPLEILHEVLHEPAIVVCLFFSRDAFFCRMFAPCESNHRGKS